MKLKVNGINLFYEEYGSGTPVIFLHGYPLNHTIWSDVAPLLVGGARVILPDLRGHGQTDCPEGPYSMATLAADILGLLDSLGQEKAVLVGHSMGGYASLAFALKYPQRLSALGLVASQAAADNAERKAARYAIIQDVRQNGVRGVADAMAEKLSSREEFIPLIRQMILSTRPEGVIGSLMGLAERPDVTGQLGEIAAPSVVIAGAVDKINSLERSQEMARGLPNGRLVVVDGAGHMPMMEAPRAVADVILNLISPVVA